MRMSATRIGGHDEDSMTMDYSATLSSNPRDSESWNWQGGEFGIQKYSNLDVSGSQWNEVTLNEEDLSYMLDDEATTPVKACGDLAYHATQSGRGDMSKELKEQRETYSQAKRRRVLQFDTQVVDASFCCEEMTSALRISNEREDSVKEVLPEASQWTTGLSGVSASSCDGLDSFEGWFAECLNDPEMNFSPSDMEFSGASDLQIDVSEFCNSPPPSDTNVVQQQVTRTPRNVIFKGRKSLTRTPTKLASSVAYPFAFIKPCGVHGDVTLNDINQWIHSPASKLKQNIEDPSAYPTSAFSGKPVVGKTKIRTEGGKGSITIMRTKG